MKKHIKRLISIFLVVSFVFVISIHIGAVSEEELTAPSALLMEPETGKVLYEKNPHEIRVCASITKVMTLLLVMEALDEGKISLGESVTASDHAASMGGSDIWLKPGEVMSVDEMIKAVVVVSANDAAVALAEHISGSEEAFVSEMNKRAAELLMNDTVFKNCNGLDEDGHVTSAYDVALMSRELMKHKEIFNYTNIWIDYLRDGKTQLVNTNKLLKSYNGITGLKTGTTSKAGSCISATAKRDNMDLVAVVLGSASGKDRFKDAAKLLDYGFANYAMSKQQLPEKLEPIKVINGMENTVDVKVNVDNKILVSKGKEKNISSEIKMDEEVVAPVEEGQKVGKVVYSLDNEVVAEYDIIAKDSVKKITFPSIFNILLKRLISL